MSFWFRRTDPDGRVHIISTEIVGLVLALAVAVVGVLLGVLLPWMHWFRAWIQGG